jgi:hypothetical protein
MVSFISLRGWLLKIKVIVTRKDCYSSLQHVLKVIGFSVGFVQLLGNEVFMQCSAVVGVETVPENGVLLTLGYPSGIEEGLTECVEVAVVVDHICLFFHR